MIAPNALASFTRHSQQGGSAVAVEVLRRQSDIILRNTLLNLGFQELPLIDALQDGRRLKRVLLTNRRWPRATHHSGFPAGVSDSVTLAAATPWSFILARRLAEAGWSASRGKPLAGLGRPLRRDYGPQAFKAWVSS